MKRINISTEMYPNTFAIVDDSDFNFLNHWKWAATPNSSGIKMRAYRSWSDQATPRLMHRFLLSPPDEMDVDHRNGDTLDNRRENLRICTHLENGQNQMKHKTNTSGYKGV